MLANVERLAHGGLARARCRGAAHHINGAPNGDDAEAVTRGRKVRPALPLAGGRVENVDIFERTERLLSPDHKDPVADYRGADPAAGGRDVGHRLPCVAPRVVALERC